MDFRFTPEQEALREEVRRFLDEELPRESLEIKEDNWVNGFSPRFSRKLGQRGWIGMTWPPQYGGQGKSYLDRLIVTEELLRRGAPVFAHWLGDRQVGPAILAYGSEEQKREFLPRICRGEIVFCIGMSEPEAGSDLASLQTRAVEEGEDFIINGQKVWTSGAQHADYCYLVARTDPTVAKHRGISEFIVDMKLPGITVRPLEDLTGQYHLHEVFFDNVRVPRTALIGTKNRGWYQIASQLDYERSGIERLMSNYPLFQELLELAREKGWTRNPVVRHKLAELMVEFEVGRLLIYRVAWLLSQGVVPNYEAAMAKFFGTEFEQRLADAITRILGLYGQLLPGSPRALLSGRAARAYLYSPAYTIQGGTSEILRNIVALRGLGLPGG
jgi:alkylation response protein AidB-like acyl-CoA dehydrogenase